MSVTVSKVATIRAGTPTTPAFIYGEVTGDSAYVVGGYSIAASDFGLITIDVVLPSAAAGYNVSYVKTNSSSGKLVFYVTANATTSAGTLVESSVRDLSGLMVTVVVIGRA